MTLNLRPDDFIREYAGHRPNTHTHSKQTTTMTTKRLEINTTECTPNGSQCWLLNNTQKLNMTQIQYTIQPMNISNGNLLYSCQNLHSSRFSPINGQSVKYHMIVFILFFHRTKYIHKHSMMKWLSVVGCRIQ